MRGKKPVGHRPTPPPPPPPPPPPSQPRPRSQAPAALRPQAPTAPRADRLAGDITVRDLFTPANTRTAAAVVEFGLGSRSAALEQRDPRLRPRDPTAPAPLPRIRVQQAQRPYATEFPPLKTSAAPPSAAATSASAPSLTRENLEALDAFLRTATPDAHAFTRDPEHVADFAIPPFQDEAAALPSPPQDRQAFELGFDIDEFQLTDSYAPEPSQRDMPDLEELLGPGSRIRQRPDSFEIPTEREKRARLDSEPSPPRIGEEAEETAPPPPPDHLETGQGRQLVKPIPGSD
ncbi:hypothetical protein O0L34_g19104 [Tuta absoluta]|nr:hypothetical protein O0L34_g19104 [Tuta absoluta]